MNRKGFTLIELLIVIGVLAILATAVVLVLNPAEILRRTRDSQRLNDFRTIQNAINLYLLRNTSPQTTLGTGCIGGSSSYPQWRASISGVGTIASGYPEQPFINSTLPNNVEASTPLASPKDVGGSGWISINFNQMADNAPFSRLPVDPINNAPANSTLAGPIPVDFFGPGIPLAPIPGAYFYAYQCLGLTYEINTNMESQKYGTDSLTDSESLENKDGGTNARIIIPGSAAAADLIYEVGNKQGLDL